MLYIMRHGKTDWNVQRRLQGRTDIPLNDEGRRMAQAARAECLGVHFDICCCSPLVRARETAELLLEGRGVPIVTDDRLKEMCFGRYEGRVVNRENPGDSFNVFFDAPEQYVPPEGGESFDELFARTGEFLNEIALPRVREGRDVLIVGHGAMNASIICQVKGLPVNDFWRFGLANCQLIRLL